MAAWFLYGLVAALLVWALGIALLVVAGRRGDAVALARLVPDCLVLLTRLARDPRLTRGDRVAIAAVLGYLALPFDVVPDFIPVAGQLDDVIIVGLLIRRLCRTIPGDVVRELWPGPPDVLDRIMRVPRLE